MNIYITDNGKEHGDGPFTLVVNGRSNSIHQTRETAEARKAIIEKGLKRIEDSRSFDDFLSDVNGGQYDMTPLEETVCEHEHRADR